VTTDPIIIVPEKNYASFMIQTDPIIDEREAPDPVLLTAPRENLVCSQHMELLDIPRNEIMQVL